MIDPEKAWSRIEYGKDPLTGRSEEKKPIWPSDEAYWNDFIKTVNRSHSRKFELKQLVYKEPIVVSTLKDGDFEITFTIHGRYGEPDFWKVDTYIESTFMKKNVGRYDWGGSGVSCAHNLWSQLIGLGFTKEQTDEEE